MASKITLLILIVVLGVGCGGKKKVKIADTKKWELPDSLQTCGGSCEIYNLSDSEAITWMVKGIYATTIPNNGCAEVLYKVRNSDNTDSIWIGGYGPHQMCSWFAGVYLHTDTQRSYRGYIIQFSKRIWDSLGLDDIVKRAHEGTTSSTSNDSLVYQFGDTGELPKAEKKFVSKRDVALKQGWCCDPGTPSSIISKRIWDNSTAKHAWQVGDTTIVGDSSVKIPIGKSTSSYFNDVDNTPGAISRYFALRKKDTTKKGFSLYMDGGYSDPVKPIFYHYKYIVYWTRSGCFSKEQFTDTIEATSMKDARKIFQKRLNSWPKVFMIFNTIDSVKRYLDANPLYIGGRVDTGKWFMRGKEMYRYKDDTILRDYGDSADFWYLQDDMTWKKTRLRKIPIGTTRIDTVGGLIIYHR